ncbi:hypothetical protein [Spirosoma sp.]|uniref:hypothetical protein n=1 Tax=Spirosoma sp. TaxID=1899569 RepID=UPI003B3A95B8
MDTNNSSFEKLLEQYTLKVASHFIDSIDSASQAQIIEMIRGINCSSVSDIASGSHIATEVHQSDNSEWQLVLSQPIDWHAVHRQMIIDQVRQLAKLNESRIHQLEQVLSSTEHRYKKAKMTFWHEPYRTRLLGWYELLLEKYHNQLIRPRIAQQQYLELLNQL